MNIEKKVNNNILNDWFIFREQSFICNTSKEDKKHFINLDKIYNTILENIPKENQKIIKQQLDLIDKNILDYISYWNEKYYKNGFSDGINLILNLDN